MTIGVPSTGPQAGAQLSVAALGARLKTIEDLLTLLEINRTPPPLALAGLSNCGPMTKAANGNAPIYNAATGLYEPGGGGGGSGTIPAGLLGVDGWGPPGVGGGPGVVDVNLLFGGVSAETWLVNDPRNNNLANFGSGLITNMFEAPQTVCALPRVSTPNFTGVSTISVVVWLQVLGFNNAHGSQGWTGLTGPTARLPLSLGPNVSYQTVESDFFEVDAVGGCVFGPDGVTADFTGIYFVTCFGTVNFVDAVFD